MKYTTKSSLSENDVKKEVLTKNQNMERAPVVSKPAKVKKRGIAKEFVDEFVPDDMDVVKQKILSSVLVPMAKNIIMSVIDIFLNDGKRSSSTKSYTMGRSVNGSKYRSSLEDYGTSLKPASDLIRSSSRIDIYLLYDDRKSADDVLEDMFRIVNKGGIVSVAEYYNMSGLPSPDFTYSSYGWDRKCLVGSRVITEYDYSDSRMKYRIDLPKPVRIVKIK